MANNEVLGASFTIDITNLKAGISTANKLIRESESEFKKASAGLDSWQESEEGVSAKIKSLNEVTDIQKEKVSALTRQYEKLIKDGLDPASDQAVQLRTKLNNEEAALKKNEAELERLTKSLEEMKTSSKDAGDGIEETGKSAEHSSEGFTIARGAIANLIADGLKSMVSACSEAVSSLMSLSAETQEYREDIGKLETAFQASGKSAESASKTYKALYMVLGEEDRSVEAANHLAKLVENEEDLEKWTNICTGVWGTFGDSLPIEGLTEAANETAKVGEVTGVLADALNWAGVNEDDFQASLDACNDESERASLITETLNGLYTEASDLYKSNNKSVMEARDATSEYTDTLAEMGERLEPTTTALTELKTQLLKGLTPVLEQDVIPAIEDFIQQLKEKGTIEKFSNSISNVAQKVLPVVSKAIQFLSNNLETIVKVTYTAITAFTVLNASLKIASAIKAVQVAMSGLSTATNIATVAQTGLNAAMSANPIGAVISAISLLIGGLMLLGNSSEETAEKTDVLSESHRAAVTAAQEATEAYQNTKKAADELSASQIANVDYVQNTLLPELANLVDANGNVKDGEEARAKFILDVLNEALGTEYESLSQIVDANGKIEQSIYEVIEAKKAQILLEAYEDSYREAIEKVSIAEHQRAIEAQGLSVEQERLQDARDKLTTAELNYQNALETGDSISQGYYQKQKEDAEEALTKQQEAYDIQLQLYNDAENARRDYYTTISAYEQASTLALEGETEKAVELLGNLGTGFKTAASVAQMSADDQVATLEQQVVDYEVNLRLLEEEYQNSQGKMTEEQRKQLEARIEDAKTKADEAKTEFKRVGGEITEGIAEGSEEKSWILNTKIASLINGALKAAREAADSHSPSRKFKKLVGWTIGEGIAEGIDDTTGDVIKSIQKQSRAMENAYDLSGLSTSVDAGLNMKSTGTGSAPTTGTNGVVVYQTNNYSQTHSRYEIYKSKQATEAAVRLALGV